MKFKLFIAAALLIIAINFTPAIVHAQPEGPSDPDEEPTEVPFDGGISILVAAGVAYGVKKKYDQQKQQEKEEI